MEAYNKKYYKKNKEKEKARIKAYREANLDKVREWDRARYLRDKEKRKEIVKKNYEANKERIKEYQKKYRAKNKEKLKKYNKLYRKNNKEILNDKYLQSLKNSPLKRLTRNIRSGLSRCLSGTTKGKFRHLPYTAIELRNHIEALFEPGMTWENYGRWGWHVDHRIPLKYKKANGQYYWDQEKLTDPTSEEFQKAWGLKNLKPMWAHDNIRKGNKSKE